jgi:vitamin B12 transporter
MTTSLSARRVRAGGAWHAPRSARFLVFGTLVGLAHAADNPELQTIVISATRIPTPVLEVASSMTVVSAEDIEARQERTFADVLKQVPGLNVVQTGGPGGVTSVFMRGTNSNHTKVLLDGIDLSDPSNSTGAFDFGQLLTQDIERIEVLRGPQSGLYGSDAIGGVINIITKAGTGPAQFKGLIEGGSFDTFNQAGTLSGSQGGLHYSASVAHFHAGSVPVTPLELLQSPPAPPGLTRNNDYDDNLTLSTRLGYDLTPDFDLGLVGRYSDIHVHTTGEDYSFLPPYLGYPAAAQTTAATDEYFTRLYAHANSFGGLLDQTLGVNFSHARTSTLEPQTPATLNTGERRQVDWQGNVHLMPAETLVLGAVYERDDINEPISAEVHVSSGYAELQSQLGEHWYSAANVRYDNNSRFGSKVTYRFAPTWVIAATDTKLKASLGTGFKAPTLSALYQNFPPYFFANPNLQPETSTGWDAGIEQGFGQGAWRVGATYFHISISNLITTDPLTGTTYANVGHATTQGVESFIAYQPWKTLTLRLDYTYTEASDDATQEELLRRPKNKGSFDAAWQMTPAWLTTLDVLTVGTWVDGNRDFSVPRLDAPTYTTVNVATTYELTKRLALIARIDNLLDRHYQNPVGFQQPGFGIYGGIKASL